jgi:hypothetical protein
MATDPAEKGEIITDAFHEPSDGSDNSPMHATPANPSVSPHTTMPEVPLVSLPAPQASSSDAGNSQSQGKTLPGVQDLNSFAQEVLKENVNSLETLSRYIRRSYQTVYLMYSALFLVGLGTAIAAIVKGFSAQNGGEAIPSLIFAGLSAASFFTLFITRPLESLERNTFFSSWIVAIMDNYWTRLMYFQDPQTIDANLKDAISDLVTELSNLADKYATAIGKYPPLAGSQTASAQAPHTVSTQLSSGGTASTMAVPASSNKNVTEGA